MKLNSKYILCIFHKEKTPSLLINFINNYFHCFACNAHGKLSSIFEKIFQNFNKFKKNFNYRIKENNNENLPNLIKNKLKFYFNKTELNIFYNLMSFIQFIFSKSIKSKKILNFFIKRNITKKIIKNFNLGYSYYNSLNYIKLNYSEKFLINTGIFKIDAYDKQNYFNILYKKIVFPIKNINGKIISFSGRNVDEKKPKYINSYETYFNKKKFNLYGIWEAKNYIKKFNYIILVEGYIDVLSLHRFNIRNIAGLMGTNFTLNHINLIKNLTFNILFCLDSDIAGFKSVKNIINLLLNNNILLNIKFLILPINFDPDNYINKYGKENYLNKLKSSINLTNIIYILYIKNIFNKNKFIFLKNLYNLKLLLINIKINKNKILIFILLSKNLNINLSNFFFLLIDKNLKDNYKFDELNFKLHLEILFVLIIYPQLIYFFEKEFLKEFILKSKMNILILDILKKININNNLDFISYFTNIENYKIKFLYKNIFYKFKNIKLFKFLILKNKYKSLINNLSFKNKNFYKQHIFCFCKLLYSFI